MSADVHLKSRRSLLTAGLGALGATVASMLGRPLPVLANGEAVVVGGTYESATSKTRLANTAFGSTNTILEAATDQGTALDGSSNYGGVGVRGHGHEYRATGVRATTRFGTALKAEAEGDAAHAVVTVGRLAFDRSGVATIPAGATGVSVSVTRSPLRNSSFILLTPQANLGGRSLWYVMDVQARKFSVRMSSSRSSATRVSWLILDKFEPIG